MRRLSDGGGAAGSDEKTGVDADALIGDANGDVGEMSEARASGVDAVCAAAAVADAGLLSADESDDDFASGG